MSEPARHLVVSGVAGSGKSTIAALLAARLHAVLIEADDLHSRANVDKMQRAQPLDDADREPWLERVAAGMAAHDRAGRRTVVACSALKRRYRETLRAAAADVRFVLLMAPRPVLLERLQRRTGHFMPPTLLDSQLATQEPLAPDELGIAVDATASPEAIVAQVLALNPGRADG